MDRLGISTSYDSTDLISVTMPESLETTLNHSGLDEEDYFLPAGCIFVLMPMSEVEAEAGRSMLMYNVDFRKYPKQLFRILVSPEMIGAVRDWLGQSGPDPKLATEFVTFPDELKRLKGDIESGTVALQTLVPFEPIGKST